MIAAAAQMKVQQELTKFFEARYGATYSDVDADLLIDLFDYQGGSSKEVPTLAEVDAIMTNAGCPPKIIEVGTVRPYLETNGQFYFVTWTGRKWVQYDHDHGAFFRKAEADKFGYSRFTVYDPTLNDQVKA